MSSARRIVTLSMIWIAVLLLTQKGVPSAVRTFIRDKVARPAVAANASRPQTPTGQQNKQVPQ
jgi:hypothetical protein